MDVKCYPSVSLVTGNFGFSVSYHIGISWDAIRSGCAGTRPLKLGGHWADATETKDAASVDRLPDRILSF